MNPEELKSLLDKHQKVKVAITDIDGILRGKYIHKDKFLSAMENGFGFCSVVFGWDSSDECYDYVKIAGWHNGYPDITVRLDGDTFRQIPWERETPFFLGEFVADDGVATPVCPRGVLKKQLNHLEKLGFESRVGVEYEWFNFREDPHSLHEKHFQNMEPITPGMFGYSLIRSSQNADFFHELMDGMAAFGVPLEGIHTETGPGVYEAAIAVSDGLTAADRAVLMKSATKDIAHRFGIVPTFMARWNTDLPGSSGHVHQSLVKDGKNAFYDASDPNRMSDTFKHYLAGVLKMLPEFAVMFAPTVNSYKRLVEGFWAPTRAGWGIDNRTVACRVIPGSAKSTRLEVRSGGADINPYLAIAAYLGAGAYGIENKLPLTDSAIAGNGYEDKTGAPLPTSLQEAAALFKSSSLAQSIFGEDFVEHYATTRLWEWKKSQEAVTDWERKRYFEII